MAKFEEIYTVVHVTDTIGIVSLDRELCGEYYKPRLAFVRPSVAEIIEYIYCLSFAIFVNAYWLFVPINCC